MAERGEDKNRTGLVSDASDNDDIDGCDLDDGALFQFTQQECSQYEFEEPAEDEDPASAPGPTDYSQKIEEEVEEEDMTTPKKRLKQDHHDFRDTPDKYFVNINKEKRVFKRGEYYAKVGFISEPAVVYKIQKLFTDTNTRKKKAECKVFKLASRTFIGEQKDFEARYGKYVFYKESQHVALSDLKVRLVGQWEENFKKEVMGGRRGTVFIDPTPQKCNDRPSRDSKGVGWSVAYGFGAECKGGGRADATHGDQCPIVSAPTLVDLFAGAGGMMLGLTKAGFRSVHAVEIDPVVASTLEINHPETEVFTQDVESYLEDWKKNAGSYPFEEKRKDHIHASSPCQGFSVANRTGGKNDKQNNEKSYLWSKSLIEFGPNTGSFENVTGMLDKKHQHYLQTIMTKLLVADYGVRIGVINCADYGAAQKRHRVILLASRRGWGLPGMPEPLYATTSNPVKTAQFAIGDLEAVEPRPSEKPGMTLLPARVLVKHHARAGKAPKNEEKCLVADEPANTLICKKEIGHYSLDRNITNLERARFQQFPDEWKFAGNHADVRKQIGNAVPVGTAEAIGQAILKSCYEFTDTDYFASSEEQTVALPQTSPPRNTHRITDSVEKLREARQNFLD